MWEKIVLNLLSNAFKFTFDGEIAVELRARAARCAELVVRDTGIGIPAEELPRLFERFHRIEGSKGRTFEGSGIGLALVSELVKLHRRRDRGREHARRGQHLHRRLAVRHRASAARRERAARGDAGGEQPRRCLRARGAALAAATRRGPPSRLAARRGR